MNIYRLERDVRDVGLNQIALFEGKVAGGNGEQVLCVHNVEFAIMTFLTVHIFLYGRVCLAYSGLDEGIAKEAKLLRSTTLDAALNAQFLVQIGVFTAVPMIMGFVLELGLLKAVFSFDYWTSWLLYKGGVGVKGDNSWESWWEEEQVLLV